jgi:hypothetical protein
VSWCLASSQLGGVAFPTSVRTSWWVSWSSWVGRLPRSPCSYPELAAHLHLNEATIKTHVSSVLAKLGLRSRVQAVIAAYESGLVQPGDGRFNPKPR